MHPVATIHVTVHYIAAAHPFKDSSAQRSETVGHLKERVLSAFHLTEGQNNDGSTVTYTLNFHKTPLENPSQTLGEVAGDHKELELKLSQHLTQGA